MHETNAFCCLMLKKPSPEHYKTQTSYSILLSGFQMTTTTELTRDFLLETCRALNFKNIRLQSKETVASIIAWHFKNQGWVAFAKDAGGAEKNGRSLELSKEDIEVYVL